MKSRISLVVMSVCIMALALIGCGGGGGGSNPVASQAPATLASLSGSVTMDGVPLSNAKVTLIKPNIARNDGVAKLASIKGSLLAQTLNSDGSYSTFSDEDGKYSFTGVPVGEYTLSAVKDEKHQFTRTNIMLGSITTVDAQLTPTGSISGHIVMNSGSVSSNIAGVMVYLEGTSNVALTDGDGNFTISYVPASQTFYLNTISPKGNLVSPILVNLAPAEIKSLGDITLSPYSNNVVTLSGKMQRANSADTYSLEGQMVALWDNQTNTGLLTISDDNGDYGFIITASGSYTVRPMDDEDMTYSPVSQTISVDLSSSVTVPVFTVSQVQNQNIKKFNVVGNLAKTTRLADESDNSGIPVTLTSSDASEYPMTTVTDALGKFNFAVIQGSYTVSIGGRYKFETSLTNPIDVTADKDLGTINVIPSVTVVSMYMLTVQVNKVSMISGDSNNAGVVVSISLDGEASNVKSTITNSLGIARFEVAAGSYNLELSGDYIPVTTLTNPIVVNADTPLTINVKPKNSNPGSVECTLSGIPTNVSYRVYLTNDITSEVQYKGTSLGTGKVIFNNIYPSSYTLSLKSVDNGYSGTSSQFDVSSGESVTRTLAATLVAPHISAATFTTNLRIDGNNFVSSQQIYLDGSRLELLSQTSVLLEANANDIRPGTYTLSLKNPDGTKSDNTVEFFKPLGNPTNIQINTTDVSVDVTWNLADYAEKSKYEILDTGMTVIASGTLETNNVKYNKLSANTGYTLRVWNGVGSIWSVYSQHTFTTKIVGSNANILPKTILANTDFIDNSSMRVFGFEVIGDTYYVGWFDKSNSPGYAKITSYDTSTGTLKNTYSIASDYNVDLDHFDMTTNGTDLYLFYRNDSYNHELRKLTSALTSVSSLVFDGSDLPSVTRGKVKAFGDKVFFCGENSSTTSNAYVIGMSSNLTATSTIYTDTINFSYEFDTYTTMVTADVDNDKLYIAIASDTQVDAYYDVDTIFIKEYKLSDYSSTGASDISFGVSELLRQFLKTGTGFLVGVRYQGDYESQKYWKLTSGGYSVEGLSENRSSAGIDAQGRIWYAQRKDLSGPSYFLRTSDGFNVDKSVLVDEFANYASNGYLCYPNEFIKLDRSSGKMNMLYKDSTTGNLVVSYYNSSY